MTFNPANNSTNRSYGRKAGGVNTANQTTSTKHKRKGALGRVALLTLGVAVLGACNTTPAPVSGTSSALSGSESVVAQVGTSGSTTTTTTVVTYAYITTVLLSSTDTTTSVAKLAPGKVIAWHQNDAPIPFAVVGQSATQASATALSTKVVSKLPNLKSFKSGVANAAGVGVWSGGVGVWSGGAGVWSGGAGVWSGGLGTSPSAGQNSNQFSQVRLSQAQTLATNLGAGVKVAVIDTGVDVLHPGLTANLAPSSDWKDFVDGDANPQEGFVSGGTNAAFGHGTVVAGIVLQVAPNALIMPIRVLDAEGRGDSTNVVSAIDWAVSRGAKVINLSLGSVQNDSALSKQIQYATSKGVMVVASSGNTGDTAVSYPAAMSSSGSTGPGFVGVGSVSTTALDVKSTFSTYGYKLEMVAPGEQVYSTYPNSQLAWASGTSFATPMVAGGLALALGQGTALNSYNLVAAVSSTANPVDALNPTLTGMLGSGRLNLEAFIKKALGLL